MKTEVAGLTVDVVPEVKGPAPRRVVVLCHGFGAPGDDLVALAGELVALKPELATTRFYFPHGPLALDWGGRAWWMIDIPALQRAAGDGAARERLMAQEPPGLASARHALHRLVLEVSAQLPLRAVVLGGFSQGAMLATELALRLEEPCGGLVAMSGTVVNRDQWTARARARPTLPVFVAHGRMDPVLPFEGGEALAALFREAGAAVEFFPFDGGHTITASELTAVASSLARW